MNGQNRNLWNQHSTGGYICQHLVSQIWALRVGMKYGLSEQQSVKLPFDGTVDLPTLGQTNMSSQSRNEIWAVRVAICEIAIWWEVDLPTLGQPNMSSQSRNLQLPFDMGDRSANTLVCQIWVLRVGMKYELSEQESVKCSIQRGVDLPTSWSAKYELSE